MIPQGAEIKSECNYDAKKEETYMECLKKAFRSTVIKGMFDVIIVDCNNITLSYYLEFYTFATVYKFTVSQSQPQLLHFDLT